MPRRRAAEDTASGAHSPTAVAGWERDEPNAAQSSSQWTRWWFACLPRGVPDVAPPDEVQGSVKTTLSGLPDVEAMRRCGLPVQMPCGPRESAAGGAPGRQTSPVGRGSTAYATWSLAKIDRGTVAAISKETPRRILRAVSAPRRHACPTPCEEVQCAHGSEGAHSVRVHHQVFDDQRIVCRHGRFDTNSRRSAFIAFSAASWTVAPDAWAVDWVLLTSAVARAMTRCRWVSRSQPLPAGSGLGRGGRGS